MPEDEAAETQAAKLVWDTYYANHQKTKNFDSLRVLDPFMGHDISRSDLYHALWVHLLGQTWTVSSPQLCSSHPNFLRIL
jgi:hypothetical protein